MLAAYTELIKEEGYKINNDLYILRNGQVQIFNWRFNLEILEIL